MPDWTVVPERWVYVVGWRQYSDSVGITAEWLVAESEAYCYVTAGYVTAPGRPIPRESCFATIEEAQTAARRLAKVQGAKMLKRVRALEKVADGEVAVKVKVSLLAPAKRRREFRAAQKT